MPRADEIPDAALFGEIQVVLSEKRTALSTLRTGIAVFALPLSVLSVLVATSKYYELGDAVSFLVPLLTLSVGLIVLGVYLIIHAMLQIRRHDRLISSIKRKHSRISEFLD